MALGSAGRPWGYHERPKPAKSLPSAKACEFGVPACRDLYPVGCPSSVDGSSLDYASLHPSYPVSAIPRYPPHWLQRRKQFRGGSLHLMLRPAPLLERLTSPCRQLAPPTRPPVYGRACPSRGLPQPRSAMTTRPNHPLPRQDLHPQACQRPKAAHRNLLFARPPVLSAARVKRQPSPQARTARDASADRIGCPMAD